MDGGFATREDITALEQRGAMSVYAPVRLPRNKPERERYDPRYGDGPDVVRWRQRMATGGGQSHIQARGWSVAEWTNAQVRLHGVSQPDQPYGDRSLPKSPASCSSGCRGPQLPALGDGVDRLSRQYQRASLRALEAVSTGKWAPKLYRYVVYLDTYPARPETSRGRLPPNNTPPNNNRNSKHSQARERSRRIYVRLPLTPGPSTIGSRTDNGVPY